MCFFVLGKPVRLGYKEWLLCSETGYCFFFFPYAGASTKLTSFGLGADVVLRLHEVVQNSLHHRIFCDNFFSSFGLVELCTGRNIPISGTVRSNRIGQCPLIEDKKLSEMGRGAYDSKTDADSKIVVLKWNDNSIVHAISNCIGVEPVHKVKRWDKTQKKDITVDQPRMVQEYNQNMGGVDIHDNGIANYRIKIRGKKWYWPLFINTLDSAIVNAWRFYNMVNRAEMSQLEFRRYIVMTYLKGDLFDGTLRTHTVRDDDEELDRIQLQRGRPTTIELPDEVRKDTVGHVVVKHPENQRRRCRSCHSQTWFLCAKCDVPLHPACFLTFHS